MGVAHAGRCHLATARRLNPYRPNIILQFEALCHFMLGDYQRTAEVLRDRIERFPETDTGRMLLASTQGHLGNLEEAKATWSELMEVNPDYSFAQRRKILPYRNPDDPERIADGLRKAGIDAPREVN